MGRRDFSPKPMWKRSKKRAHQLWPLPLFLRFSFTNSPLLLITLSWQDYNSQPPAAPLNTFGTSNPVDDWNRCSVDGILNLCLHSPNLQRSLGWSGRRDGASSTANQRLGCWCWCESPLLERTLFYKMFWVCECSCCLCAIIMFFWH